MANGWTNANNFKPWTQYDIAPTTEDIIIPKRSYLSQDIIVYGDPNYASCNIIQGKSLGDIPYGSANTPIRNFACGEFYKKNESNPYTCFNMKYTDIPTTTFATTFNNHSIKCNANGDTWMSLILSNVTSGYAACCRSVNSGSNWEIKGLSRIQNTMNSSIDCSVINNIEYWIISGTYQNNIIGLYSIDNGDTWKICYYLVEDVLESYFLIGCPGKTDEYTYMGIIKNSSNQIVLIQSKNCADWERVGVFGTSSSLKPLDMVWDKRKLTYYILLNNNKIYINGYERYISVPNGITQIALGETTDNLYLVGYNKLYNLNLVSGNYTEVEQMNRLLASIGATNQINYTQWITKDYNVFSWGGYPYYIGSPDSPYIIAYFYEGTGQSSCTIFTDSFACNCFYANENRVLRYGSYQALIQGWNPKFLYPETFKSYSLFTVTIKGGE